MSNVKYLPQYQVHKNLIDIVNRLNYVENKTHPVIVANNMNNCGVILATINLRSFTTEEREEVIRLKSILVDIDFACYSSLNGFLYAIRDAKKLACELSLKYEFTNKRLFRLITPVARVLCYSETYIMNITEKNN